MTEIALTKVTNYKFDIMEGKTIFSKFTVQTQAKDKNTKIQIFLQGLLP